MILARPTTTKTTTIPAVSCASVARGWALPLAARGTGTWSIVTARTITSTMTFISTTRSFGIMVGVMAGVGGHGTVGMAAFGDGIALIIGVTGDGGQAGITPTEDGRSIVPTVISAVYSQITSIAVPEYGQTFWPMAGMLQPVVAHSEALAWLRELRAVRARQSYQRETGA